MIFMNLIRLKEIFLDFKKGVIRIKSRYITSVKIVEAAKAIARRYRQM